MTDRQKQRCKQRLRAFINRAGGPAKVAATTDLAEITIRQWCLDDGRYPLPNLQSLSALHRIGLDLNKLISD